MQITINLSNKTLAIFVGLLTFLVIGLVVYAYSNIPNPGHGADQIVVNIDGQEMTLQEAIDSGKIGGRLDANNVMVNIGGVQKTLQQVINDGDFKEELVCTMLRLSKSGKWSFISSTDGVNYNPSTIVEPSQSGGRCKGEWKLISCFERVDRKKWTGWGYDYYAYYRPEASKTNGCVMDEGYMICCKLV